MQTGTQRGASEMLVSLTFAMLCEGLVVFPDVLEYFDVRSAVWGLTSAPEMIELGPSRLSVTISAVVPVQPRTVTRAVCRRAPGRHFQH